jgi:acetoin utilization deacetylase AcuC-like enzyme
VAVTTAGFGRLGERIGALRLPTVIVQEGGYQLDTLDTKARAFFGGFGQTHR